MLRRDELRVLRRASPLIQPHLDVLAEKTVKQVVSTIPFYRDTALIAHSELRTFSLDNFEYIVSAYPNRRQSATSPPREMGRVHAQRGAPLADLLSAYKIGFALLWDIITHELVETGALDPDEAISLARVLFWRAAEFGQEILEGHREVTTVLVLRQEHERSAMVEALVTGTLVERAALWETASRLDIPIHGHFLVAVAAADPLGGDPLPGIAERLQKERISSAWRLSPHQSVGIISFRDADPAPVIRQLDECGTGNVGLSPAFTELDEAPRSFYLAGVALRSTPRGEGRIRKFNETPVAVLVAAAPDAAVAIMRNVLGKVLEASVREQDALIETFEMWFRCGGSATEAATRLFVHPNTVRLRLRKLTEITGRHVDNPADVVELVTAIYAWRLVGQRGSD